MGAVADVQTYLAAQGLVDGSTGWPSVRRNLHDNSNQLVKIEEDGGPNPELPAGTGLGDSAVAMVGVHVTVRGEPFDGDSTAAKAQAILDALHGLYDTTIGSNTYTMVRAMTGEPVSLPPDANNRRMHTVAFRMMRDIN